MHMLLKMSCAVGAVADAGFADAACAVAFAPYILTFLQLKC